MNKLDKLFLESADYMFKAYNWTFGGTKSQFANDLLTIASVVESTGWINSPTIVPYFIIPLSLLNSHLLQRVNIKMEERELKALERKCLDSDVEEFKVGSIKTAHLTLGIGTVIGIPLPHSKGRFFESRTESDLLITAGFYLRSISSYAMILDNLPPKKNCFSRGLDRLSELSEMYIPRKILA